MALTVQFTDESTPGPSGPITDWAWDFGDSGTSALESPSHTYSAPGIYTVTLTVTGSGADGTAETAIDVNVVDTTVSLTSSYTYSVSGLAVSFTDASVAGPSGPITAYHWDFGDGNTSSSASPSHTYASAGSYTVALTVTGTSPDGTNAYSHAIPVSAAGSTFISVSSFSRPSFTPSRTVNFSTLQGLKDALADMTAGDLIKYNGSGVLPITVSSGNGLNLTGYNPSSTVVIDFGCSHNVWDPTKVTPNYVQFIQNGTTAGNSCVRVNQCSNLRIYGGDLGPNLYGSGIRFMGPTNNVLWWDSYIHNIGGSGIMGQGITVAGASSYVTNCSVRSEVNRFCMNPGLDNHADKGTGQHGCILHGNLGSLSSNTWIIYAHDALQPGESSVGRTWPEGGGGSACEIGQDSGGTNDNNTYYIYGSNLNMDCTGNNFGSNGAKQTGGNVINWWGGTHQNNATVAWAEGVNISGQVSHGTPEAWSKGSITFSHGRSTNTNQVYPHNGLSSATDPYDRRWGITYNDCT